MDAQDTGTRLTRKGRATRERIVTAAAALTYQRGVAGTSTEDVQQAADVSASQLYHYFAGKEEILFSIHEEFIDLRSSGREWALRSQRHGRYLPWLCWSIRRHRTTQPRW